MTTPAPALRDAETTACVGVDHDAHVGVPTVTPGALPGVAAAGFRPVPLLRAGTGVPRRAGDDTTWPPAVLRLGSVIRRDPRRALGEMPPCDTGLRPPVEALRRSATPTPPPADRHGTGVVDALRLSRLEAPRPATAPASMIRRDVKVGAKTYSVLTPGHRAGLAGMAAVGSRNGELAKNIARWMIEGAEHHAFEGDADAGAVKFRAYVAQLVDAIVQTAPSYSVALGRDPVDQVSGAWPATNTFDERFGRDNNKLVKQVPQERGDMHDIRAALHLDPKLYVVVLVRDSRRLADAAAIIDYYRGFGDRVKLVCGGGLGPLAAKAQGASKTTELLVQRADEARIGQRDRGETPTGIGGELQAATTGNAHVDFAAQYDQVLKALHFPDGPSDQPYALINFRASGHGNFGPRSPSHPELDTGTAGFRQVWERARFQGYVPVPVGAVPAAALKGCRVSGDEEFDAGKHPTLVDYFKRVDRVVRADEEKVRTEREAGRVYKPLARRQLEYGIFGRLAAQHPRTVAIGMRSGGLDAIAYAGIRVLSIDVAAEFDPDADRLDPAHGHTSSWRRAAKRELILPGRFHQAFMGELRDMADLADPGWVGKLSRADVRRIGKSLAAYFGTGDDAGRKNVQLKEQPVPVSAPDVMTADLSNFLTKLAQIRDRDGADVPISPELGRQLGITGL